MDRLGRPVVIGLATFTILIVLAQGTSTRSRRRITETPAATQPVDTQQRPLAEAPTGLFVYLFDVSRSVHPGTPDEPFTASVALLRPTFEALKTLQETLPQEHRVGTIGNHSLGQHPTCLLIAQQQTLFAEQDNAIFDQRVLACEKRLGNAPIEPYTDIRGALTYAHLAIQGERPALRGIVVFSDMEEDLDPAQVPATPSLSGICVAFFMMVTPKIASQANLLPKRSAEWKANAKKWNAQDVYFATTIGFSAPELAAFFRRCGQRGR